MGTPCIQSSVITKISTNCNLLFILANRCLFQGCSKPRFYDVTTGELKDYCGRSHAIEHKERLAAIWIQRPHRTLSCKFDFLHDNVVMMQ